MEEGEEKERKNKKAAGQGENLQRDGFYGKYQRIQRCLLLATSVYSQGAAGRGGDGWAGAADGCSHFPGRFQPQGRAQPPRPTCGPSGEDSASSLSSHRHLHSGAGPSKPPGVQIPFAGFKSIFYFLLSHVATSP